MMPKSNARVCHVPRNQERKQLTNITRKPSTIFQRPARCPLRVSSSKSPQTTESKRNEPCQISPMPEGRSDSFANRLACMSVPRSLQPFPQPFSRAFVDFSKFGISRFLPVTYVCPDDSSPYDIVLGFRAVPQPQLAIPPNATTRSFVFKIPTLKDVVCAVAVVSSPSMQIVISIAGLMFTIVLEVHKTIKKAKDRAALQQQQQQFTSTAHDSDEEAGERTVGDPPQSILPGSTFVMD
mmetsp:Transcript_32672/g.55101  ORF Transcript_32672/g.55101 Transcript_32672/m.55101 type:complete len:238 (-) Transcript_32672:246-959(-)